MASILRIWENCASLFRLNLSFWVESLCSLVIGKACHKNKPKVKNEYKKSGSASRTRTCDPLINSQLLYQLSYCGIFTLFFLSGQRPSTPFVIKAVPINTKILSATTIILLQGEVFSKCLSRLDIQVNILAKKRELESSRRC